MTHPCEQRWKENHPEKAEEYRRDFRKNHPDYDREYRKIHPQSKTHSQKWREQNPEKVKAETKARIIPLGSCCAKCGTTENLERHHPDYSKPLEVVFLCSKHHPKHVKS